MRLDFPTVLGIGTVSILCIFAVIIGFFGNDIFSNQITESSSVNKLESDAETLVQLNQQVIKYQKNDEQEKFVEQINMMQKKLNEIASDSLGIAISNSDPQDGFGGYLFPYRDSSELKFREDQTPFPICNIEEKIPIHLQKIRETEMFQMFFKKYAQYKIELDIMDERLGDSLIHYGFLVTSEDGNKTATTFFHVNSCTDTIHEQELNNLLWCKDGSKDYRMQTHFRDDIVASLEHDEFCIIPLDPWRQSVYDYMGTISAEISYQHETFQGLFTVENMHKIKESQEVFESEIDRLELLMKLTRSIFEGKIDEQTTQESIQEYRDGFGDIPEELLELVEQRE